MATTFKTYSKQGDELEDLVEELLKEEATPYTRHKVGDDGDLTLQHMGDFKLDGYGVYLECKNDKMFSKTGNLYLEVGEIRTKSSPKDARTIQPVGILKHGYKAPTVMVHQIGEDDFFVYSARKAISCIFDRPQGFFWNEREDSKADREDKVNVGVLIKASALSSSSTKIRNTFRRTDETGLMIAVRHAIASEMSFDAVSKKTIGQLAQAFGRTDHWTKMGWRRYALLAH